MIRNDDEADSIIESVSEPKRFLSNDEQDI
jgi:hypothetical protein